MSKLIEFFIPKESTQQWNFKINDNLNFQDELWDLSFLLNNKRSSVYNSSHINFRLLSSKPLIIEPIKRYIYIRLGRVKLSTVSSEYAALSSKLILFLETYNIDSLEVIDREKFIEFNHWLQRNYLNGCSLHYLSTISNTLFQIITTGQALAFPNLPKESIELECSIWEWWGINKRSKKRESDMTNRAIPLALWKEILQKAWSEPSIIRTVQLGKSQGLVRLNHAKFSILIQAYTGLRISEILYLKQNSISKDANNRYWLTAQIEKTEIEAINHTILIPQKVYELIEELEALSRPLSDESDEKNYLFYLLSKPKRRATNQTSSRYKPTPLESGKYNSTILRPFLKRNNINEHFKNSENEIIKLTSHCFRHTFANIAVAQKGLNAKVLQTHFKHLSLEMTMHYIHLHKEILKESYIKGMIDSHEDILTQGKEGKEFKKVINEATTVEDTKEITQQLSRLFGINPLPFGLCLYDFKRGHCPHLGTSSCYIVGCSDFITNRSFLKNFQHEKQLLQEQVIHTQKSGQTIENKKIKFHLQKVETIIQTLQKD